MKFVKKVKRAGWVIGLAGLLLALTSSMAPVRTNALSVEPDDCMNSFVCQIRAAAGGKCMNVTGYQMQDGALIQQWTCNINSANSTIKLLGSAATPGAYYIVFEHSGKCLSSPAAGSGPQLIQETCDGTRKQQRWLFQQVGDGNSYRLYNMLYARYAHPYPPYGVNGSAVKQQLCSVDDYACNWTLYW